ncbi:hypothetical protein GOBAR_AA33137 [Gossypium barbadense]|uniref:Uncharacterized protein n=1 Tax=Gossypium barbadense TaxID=3634 RepID=A0A2P5W8X1_GOSBA|nr:hypothetical protein GOBAR_AA33137 [Gossypium barbadense]
MLPDAPTHQRGRLCQIAPHHRMAHAADSVRGYLTSGGQMCRRLLLQKGRDREDSFIVGMARQIITKMDRRSTVGNLTGGRGHRRPGMRWAWAMPRITPVYSISLPPKELKKLG